MKGGMRNEELKRKAGSFIAHRGSRISDRVSLLDLRNNLPKSPTGQEAEDVGEFVGEVEGAAEVGEGLEGFHQEAIEDDGQEWQKLSVSCKFLWPGPEEKKGESGIHAQVNDFVGMHEEFDIRQIP